MIPCVGKNNRVPYISVSLEGSSMLLGLLADLHGDLDGFSAALTILDRLGADPIVCAGDVAERGGEAGTIVRLLQERSTLTACANWGVSLPTTRWPICATCPNRPAWKWQGCACWSGMARPGRTSSACSPTAAPRSSSRSPPATPPIPT